MSNSHLHSALRQARRDNQRIGRQIRAMVPEIRRLAESGDAEMRELANRWLERVEG